MILELAHTEYGEAGPPVVILHGLLGSNRNWATIAKRLADGHRVFGLDLRNHGGSPWSDVMSYEAMADDLGAFIDRRGLGPAAVVGHSMGGKVAMHFALTRPEQVARLVVVDIAPVRYEHGFEAFIEAMRRVDLGRTDRRAEVERMLAAWIPDVGVRHFLLQNLVRHEESFAWRPNLDALAARMEEILGFPAAGARLYEGPTLFIVGERSHYVRPEHRREITRLFPRAEVTTIAQAGHWVHAEQPQAFLAHLQAFLTDRG